MTSRFQYTRSRASFRKTQSFIVPPGPRQFELLCTVSPICVSFDSHQRLQVEEVMMSGPARLQTTPFQIPMLQQVKVFNEQRTDWKTCTNDKDEIYAPKPKTNAFLMIGMISAAYLLCSNHYTISPYFCYPPPTPRFSAPKRIMVRRSITIATKHCPLYTTRSANNSSCISSSSKVIFHFAIPCIPHFCMQSLARQKDFHPVRWTAFAFVYITLSHSRTQSLATYWSIWLDTISQVL